MDLTVPAVEVLGVRVARLERPDALRLVEEIGDQPGSSYVVYVNAHTLNLAHRDPEYKAVLNRAALVLNDGAGVAMAGRMKKAPFPENLNGSDFNPQILKIAARRRWTVYFLGAREGVAERAAAALRQRIPDLTMAGVHDGYFPEMSSNAIAERIKASGADLLMVALGNPRQELWLADHLAQTGVSLGVGVGAFFDFAAGEVPRAPAWMNRMGIEWVYRLSREPRRLFKRYVVGNPAFLARAWRDRKTS